MKRDHGLTARRAAWCGAVCLALLLAACDSNDGILELRDDCSLPERQFLDGGVGKDGIPALTDPRLVDADAADYLSPASRVIGLVVDGRAVAVPHNILWWHEIANFGFSGLDVAVTYCPLTGSSMAFDRAAVGGGEFGVSGLLFQSNLTMYDRTASESLWPQMHRAAGCGSRDGTALEMVPVVEMRWDAWQALFPDTRVVSQNTGHGRNYNDSGYPYGDYERKGNAATLVPVRVDRRRPPKERLLGIPQGDGGLAFPFDALGGEDGQRRRAVHEHVGGEPVVVFWDADAEGAMAYRPLVDGDALAFTTRDGRIVDEQTGSTWTLMGTAVDGPLAGTHLAPVEEAYVAFWFAWAVFQPATEVWEGR